MHKPLLLSTFIIASMLIASALIYWLNASPSPYRNATKGTNTSPVGSNEFRNELIARGLADCLNDPRLDKNNVLEKFCLGFQDAGAASGGWVGHSLTSNPYGIQFIYKDSGGAVVASTLTDGPWQDQHRPTKGDLLQIEYRKFVAEVRLTEPESASIYFYFFGE